MFKLFLAPLKEIGPEEKKNLVFLGGAYFLTLMSYPIIRSSSDAFFIQSHGVKNWPWVTFYSVIVLSLCIFFFNRVQKKIGVKGLFVTISLFSFLFFFCSALAFKANWLLFSYAMYVWKESYIVILVHLCLGFFNTHFSYGFAKSFLGPFGGIASIGAILGGIFTSSVTREIGVFWLMITGAIICLVTPLFFIMLSDRVGTKTKERPQVKPLASVQGLWPYLMSIIGIILITQFIINTMNFKFNSAVQDHFLTVVDKTVFFGKTYTLVNVITVLIQFLLTPFALRAVSLRNNHFLIVGIYLVGLIPLLIFQGHLIMIISTVFIVAKAIDYSLFGVIKEMLYYPLDEYQKYGAKYIVDVVMYRASKGLVSLFLTQIQNFKRLDHILVVASLIWLALVFKVFRLHSRLKNKEIVHKQS